MDLLLKNYNSKVANNEIVYDINQEYIINELSVLFNKILLRKKKNVLFDMFNFFNVDTNLGVYIWGDVGRGKTYLVDMFYTCLPIDEKLRIHFHNFMSFIHSKLKLNSGIKDPLKIIAQELSKKYYIICLDEFFVSDIGDAMVLSELFKYFFYFNLNFVITSNVVPKNLYNNGLQRKKFISTIDMFYRNLNVINISGNLDYRFRSLEKEDVYLYPISRFNLKRFRNLFFKLSAIKPIKKESISILNRKIQTIYNAGSIVWFDFDIICGDGRSQLDYIELSLMFDTIFVSNLKSCNLDDDKCKRFISMIDEFYDNKINIIILSDKKIDDIYFGKKLVFDFKRTCSRIFEMGSKKYLKDFKK